MIDIEFNFIDFSEEIPPYGEALLIRVNGVIQNITWELDGNEEGAVVWFTPYCFGDPHHELNFSPSDARKLEWVMIENVRGK